MATNWLERATERIDNNPTLHTFRHILLADGASDENYRWIATVTIAELALYILDIVNAENQSMRAEVKRLQRFEPAAYRGGK